MNGHPEMPDPGVEMTPRQLVEAMEDWAAGQGYTSETTSAGNEDAKVVVRDPARARAVPLPRELVTTDLQPVLSDPSIQVAVEVAGGVDWTRRAVLDMEPRDSPIADDHGPFVGNWLANSRANQIGRDLPTLRSHDILRGIDLLGAILDVQCGPGVNAGQRRTYFFSALRADQRVAVKRGSRRHQSGPPRRERTWARNCRGE